MDILNSPIPTANGPNEMVYFANSPTLYGFFWENEIIQILNKIGLFAFNLISITIFMLPAVFFFHKSFKIKILVIFSILLLAEASVLTPALISFDLSALLTETVTLTFPEFLL